MKIAQLGLIAVAVAGGWCAARFVPATHNEAVPAARKIVVYQSPMHPWVKSDKPGTCTVCGMKLVPIYEGSRGYDGTVADMVMLQPGAPNVVGVATDEVKKQPLARTLRVGGVIGEDESRHGIITAPVEGRLDGLAMSGEGDRVNRRQPLATVFSRTLLAAANDYKVALEKGEAAVEEATRRLERYGLVTEQIKTIPQRQPDDVHFGILAQLSGTIVKSYVSEGQYVKEGEKMFEIADLSRLWFVFTAYAQDVPLLKVGQMVSVRTPSLPGRTLKARVGFISPNFDEVTHSARVRVVLENPERLIKNNTYAEGIVELGEPEVVAIPRSAVLWPGGEPKVYVEMAEGSYQQRSVRLGRAGDKVWEVLDGLSEGERVVISGNMLIDGQAQLNTMANAPEVPSPMTRETAAIQQPETGN